MNYFRTVTLLSCMSIASFATHTAFAAKKNSEVDFERLNPVVQVIAQQVIAGDHQIELAYPYFDPAKSSFQNERLHYSTTGTIKNTPWSPNHTAQAQGTVEFWVDRVSPLTGVYVGYETKMATDFLALIRHGAKEGHAGFYGYEPGYEPRFKSLLARTSTVQTMQQLYQLIQEGQSLSHEMIQALTVKAVTQVKCLNDMTCGSPTMDQYGTKQPDYRALSWAQAEEEKFRRLLATFESNQIEFESDTIKIKNLHAQGYLAFDNTQTTVKKCLATLTDKGITFSGLLFTERSQAELNKNKSKLKTRLNNLIMDAQDERSKLQNEFREILQHFKEFMNYHATGHSD